MWASATFYYPIFMEEGAPSLIKAVTLRAYFFLARQSSLPFVRMTLKDENPFLPT
jgi:hypothetical protein